MGSVGADSWQEHLVNKGRIDVAAVHQAAILTSAHHIDSAFEIGYAKIIPAGALADHGHVNSRPFTSAGIINFAAGNRALASTANYVDQLIA